MPQYILALDQGTTSSRALLFDAAGEVAALAQQEFRQNYPRPGWVEHDAREIWSAQYAVARRALEHAGVDVKSVAAIAITNLKQQFCGIALRENPLPLRLFGRIVERPNALKLWRLRGLVLW